ncbi:GGDEF domain-containing protein [Halarcobacter bivalviorum]|uniref:GGDEF domain-containing protein n=1 Tax=Halarcobacter bivalviorum TaxID=663364 RepID=UPI00100AACEB|nr:GGDEF domain-containing protein [Halarcobacter bivalviorum]RXK04480.1 GGDEF domain-containing protein [Halarcobacter bivalviorum]
MKTYNPFLSRFFLIFVSIFVSISLFLLLSGITKFEERFENKVLEVVTADIIGIIKNTSKSIQSNLQGSDNYIETIKKSTMTRMNIENKLTVLLTDNIKYAYLLYKDKNDVFRFLADGASAEHKAFLNQKFDVESSQWYDIYKTKEAILIKQPLLHQLSITYLEPILKDEKVELLLVIDFSIEKTKDVNEVITLVKDIIISINILVVIFILILIIQTLKYYTVKKTAYIDKLTNVYNRNYLQENEDKINLEDYILAALDIDYFKKVNDTFGHDAGDLVLKEVSKTILESTRSKEDLIIRYGGEEFIILAKRVKGQEEKSLSVIERIHSNIQKKKFRTSIGETISISVSIGVNLYPNEARNFKNAFKLADEALYKAKDEGRNRIIIDKEKN